MRPNEYQKLSRAILNSFMNKAQNYENKEMILLANQWSGVSNHLQDLIIKLSEKEILSADQLFKLDLYQKFITQSKFEVSKFNQLALNTVKDGQSFYAHLGIDATQKSIELVTVNFNRINFDAVNSMIGLSGEGSPLYDLFAKSYPESIAKLTNTLINGTALGYNPEKTARLLAANMDGNLSRALTIARTEQLNVMRDTSLTQMQESGVCKGWIRVEESDACDECAVENGKSYGFEDSFDTHPNCRGGCIPDVG